MSTSAGCLTLAGAMAAAGLSAGSGAEACPRVAPWHDAVSNHASLCIASNYGSLGLPGYQGVCLASITEAVTCASTHFAGGSSVDSYTLSVGYVVGTTPFYVDLTHDTGLVGFTGKSIFQLGGISPAPAFSPAVTNTSSTTCANGGGCFIITGADSTSSDTTIVTPAGLDTFRGDNVNHLVIEHMTLKQPAETILQGVYVSAGTAVVSTGGTTSGGGSATETLATMTLDLLDSPTNIIQDPSDFAGVAASILAPNPCGSPSPCSVNIVLDTSLGTCSTSPTVTAYYDGGAYTTVQAIATPAVCSLYPPPTSTPVSGTLVTAVGGSTATNTTFYVAYKPSPMAEYIRTLNIPINILGLHAYTNQHQPARILSCPSGAGCSNTVINDEHWGKPPSAAQIPPLYVTGSSSSNRWMLTLNNPLLGGATTDPIVSTYFAGSTSGTPNLVCVHTDSGNGVYFNDLLTSGSGVVTNNGWDITLNDDVWINAARNTFRGMVGVQILNNTIERDGSPSSQQPCYSASGGFQIGQPDDPDTYGHTISGLIATATADDTVAIFNGVLNDGSGGASDPAFPQYPTRNKIESSAISDDGHRAINLYSSLNLPNGTNSCTLAVLTHGAQVDVDTGTRGNIVNCDPCTQDCPVSYTNHDHDDAMAKPKAKAPVSRSK